MFTPRSYTRRRIPSNFKFNVFCYCDHLPETATKAMEKSIHQRVILGSIYFILASAGKLLGTVTQALPTKTVKVGHASHLLMKDTGSCKSPLVPGGGRNQLLLSLDSRQIPSVCFMSVSSILFSGLQGELIEDVKLLGSMHFLNS